MDRPLWRLLLAVTAIVLFLAAGCAACGWIDGPNVLGCIAFGAAAAVGSRL